MKGNEIKIISPLTEIDHYNQEYILPSETKNNIEGAISYAIKNGTKVDVQKDFDIGFAPKVDFSVGPCNVSFSAGFTIHTKSTKIYRMKG